ncbi:class I SAM-dependent methyltransferase [Sediminibacterium ginsengisoli]|uniref:Methyltransferase domain-containing protein n=1 Tax=Sediminibacterium ginsengisoli TaxID=413434 RepID=A0A1T4PMJ4_9BACT|nr:class I SAM-dependent methyltransferase [Sediminibacterium ginsengisoli]SJZ92476.1 Methyltransferase domain-containing protein [Sediminibacterium ginsengisoli]
MALTDTAGIFRFHKEQIRLYGQDHVGALGWEDYEGQQVRFSVLADIADLNHHSVLDVGCGHGDLRAYLGERYPHLRYFGVEQIPDLLNIAIQKYSHLPETLFFQGDFEQAELPVTDYILLSGALNYYNTDPLFVLRMIEKLYNNCRRGFGFNLLSYAWPPDGLIVSYKPEFITEYCKRLSANVVFRNNYRENDYTIFMYH